MKRINWAAVAVYTVVTLLVLLAAASIFSGVWIHGGSMMRGDRFVRPWMGPEMMWGWGFRPLFWAGMIFRWIVPAFLLILVILGIVWFVRVLSTQNKLLDQVIPPQAQQCLNCSRTVQPDWRTCPYCSTPLAKE